MDLSGRMRFEEDGYAGVSEMDVFGIFDNGLIDSWRTVLLRE